MGKVERMEAKELNFLKDYPAKKKFFGKVVF